MVGWTLVLIRILYSATAIDGKNYLKKGVMTTKLSGKLLRLFAFSRESQ
jgi:hypothetical protein